MWLMVEPCCQPTPNGVARFFGPGGVIAVTPCPTRAGVSVLVHADGTEESVRHHAIDIASRLHAASVPVSCRAACPPVCPGDRRTPGESEAGSDPQHVQGDVPS